MQLNPAEISELIKSRIEGLAVSADIRNQGTVVSVTDGICRVHGLSEAMQGEMLEFPATPDGQPTYGLAETDVERMIEAFAYLTARVRHKLDDEFPELVTALLEMLYPQYQAPVPSMSTSLEPASMLESLALSDKLVRN